MTILKTGVLENSLTTAQTVCKICLQQRLKLKRTGKDHNQFKGPNKSHVQSAKFLKTSPLLSITLSFISTQQDQETVFKPFLWSTFTEMHSLEI